MVSSQVVSVRFTTEELEQLQSQQLEGESLSLTIKRLVLGDSICKQPVNTNQADSLKAEILEAVSQMIEPLRDALLEDREKLERVANTVNDLVELQYPKEEKSLNQQKDFGFEDMTVQQLKHLCKESGIKHKTNANKAQLIELLKTKNWG